MVTRLLRPYTIFVPHPSNFLTDHRPSGDGLVAWGFIQRLADRGHRLHVATQRTDLLAAPRENLVLHELSDAPKLRAVERVRYMARLRRLYARVSAAERIDLVHQLNPVDLGLSLALPASAAPLVLGPYVPDWPRDSSRRVPGGAPGARDRLAAAARRRVRGLQQRRARLLLVSTPAAEEKVPVRRPGTRIETLPPGIDPAGFVDARAPAGERAPTVLFLANLQVRKGILVLIEAFARVAAAVPGARLVVAGTGPNEQEVRDRAAASPAAASIEIVGNLERAAVPGALAAADVYCLPSFGEPFGVSALEAMATGVAIVSTTAGGLGRLVPDEGAVKVPPRDPDALAEALIALLGDPARRAAMGRANRETVLRDYDWERVVDRLEALYDELVAP